VNTTTILDPARPGGFHLEDGLARGAGAICRSVADPREFLDSSEQDLVARFGTPAGAPADELYNDAARDLLDPIEGWQDDLDGVFVELVGEAPLMFGACRDASGGPFTAGFVEDAVPGSCDCRACGRCRVPIGVRGQLLRVARSGKRSPRWAERCDAGYQMSVMP
jgi:hypothetical protein